MRISIFTFFFASITIASYAQTVPTDFGPKKGRFGIGAEPIFGFSNVAPNGGSNSSNIRFGALATARYFARNASVFNLDLGYHFSGETEEFTGGETKVKTGGIQANAGLQQVIHEVVENKVLLFGTVDINYFNGQSKFTQTAQPTREDKLSTIGAGVGLRVELFLTNQSSRDISFHFEPTIFGILNEDLGGNKSTDLYVLGADTHRIMFNLGMSVWMSNKN